MKSGDIRHGTQPAHDLRGPADQPVQIMAFVDGDLIPASCYDQPYRLEPGKDDRRAYDVLRDIMQRTRKIGLAAVVIEKKQALAAIIPIGRTLVLNVLRLASGLVPGASREVAKPARPAPVKSKPAEAQAPRHETKSAAMRAPSRKQGEVIDLAVRRSVKRAHAPRLKAVRNRGHGVATLHELKRKSSSRSHERQLA